MFKADFADTCGKKIYLMQMWGQVEGLACANLGARAKICLCFGYEVASALTTKIFNICAGTVHCAGDN